MKIRPFQTIQNPTVQFYYTPVRETVVLYCGDVHPSVHFSFPDFFLNSIIALCIYTQ